MNNFPLSPKEYFELLEKLVNQQYDDEEDSTQSNTGAWIPAEPEIKRKLKLKENNGITDITNVKKDKIKDFIIKSNGFKVGDFLVKFIKSEYQKSDMSDLIADIYIYEEKHKTQSGQPCKLLVKLDTFKDARFSKCAWNIYFNKFKIGKNVPLNNIIEIARWLQAVRKLTAFI